MFFFWSPSNSKSPRISRTFLSILSRFNNAAVFIISNSLQISNFSSTSTNPLVVIPRVPITIGITVNFIFHWFFSSLATSMYLSLFSLSFSFTLWSAGRTKPSIRQVLFYFFRLTNTWSGHLAKIRWSICRSKSPQNLCVWFSRRDFWLCSSYLFVWSNLSFLHNSQWFTFLPVLSSLITLFVLVSCIRLECEWSFCLCNCIIYTCCFVRSCLFLLWNSHFGVVLCCYQKIISFHFSFSFLSHVQVFSWFISLVDRLKCPYSYFSPCFLFSGYFCFVDAGVVCIIFSGRNLSSSTLLYVVF